MEPFSENSVIVMRTKNVQEKGLFLDDLIAVNESFVRREEQFLREGDLLLSSANSWELVGKTSYVGKLGFNATAGGFISLVRPLAHINSRYLYHWLTTSENQLAIRMCGRKTTNISNLDVGRFKDLIIPLPPLAEQKRIAAILDKADAIRRKRQQAIQLADDFLRSVFLEMFGDPVTNPKGWDEVTLLNLVSKKLQNGAYYPKETYSDDGVEMVHMSDVFSDVIQRGCLKRVMVSNADIEKYKLTSDDLLISRRSLTYDGAAKPSMIPISREHLIFESSMIRVTPDQNKIRPQFLFQYLSLPLVKNHFIRKYVTGATIKGISQRNLENIRVIVPPLKMQDAFTKKIRAIEEMCKTTNMQSLDIEKMCSSLSQKAFSGNL